MASIQFCADGMDISGSPTAVRDAQEIRVWSEVGDPILVLKALRAGGWWGDDGFEGSRGDAVEYANKIHQQYEQDVPF